MHTKCIIYTLPEFVFHYGPVWQKSNSELHVGAGVYKINKSILYIFIFSLKHK
jgi:hypothetical protein